MQRWNGVKTFYKYKIGDFYFAYMNWRSLKFYLIEKQICYFIYLG